MPDRPRNKISRRRIAPVVLACSIALTLGACGSTSSPKTTSSRHVDEAAIAQELARELPGLRNSAAFRLQVSDTADLCRSSAEDFRINARSVATADLRRQFRRQIAAGCSWRLGELDTLFAAQDRPGQD